jgi:V/A-type H+-transporting ATPase subunit E
MTGLDKILKQIVNEAENKSKKIISEAEKEAQKIKQTAQKEAAKQCDIIELKNKNDVKDTIERAKSAAELQKRRTVLDAKQQIITETIDKAYKLLFKLPDDQYFRIVLQIIKKYILKEDGEIIFSSKDLKRLPSDFQEKINELVKDKKVSLKISKQSRKIDGGFILVYGDIEQNCSFNALFDSARERLQDKVHGLLFS